MSDITTYTSDKSQQLKAGDYNNFVNQINQSMYYPQHAQILKSIGPNSVIITGINNKTIQLKPNDNNVVIAKKLQCINKMPKIIIIGSNTKLSLSLGNNYNIIENYLIGYDMYLSVNDNSNLII